MSVLVAPRVCTLVIICLVVSTLQSIFLVGILIVAVKSNGVPLLLLRSVIAGGTCFHVLWNCPRARRYFALLFVCMLLTEN